MIDRIRPTALDVSGGCRLSSAAAAIVAAAAFAAPLAAQPCQPHWDTTIGNPGLSEGYAGALTAWDDGSGEGLYVGGSFFNVHNRPNTSLIVRWNRSNNTWSTLNRGLNPGFTNGFITSIVPFDSGAGEELIVGGFFFDAYGIADTKSIAKWNGQAWTSLGAGFDPAQAYSVWAMTKWDGVGGGERLYVGGAFPTAGGVQAGGLAAWDGAQWYSLGSGITGSFSPTVFKLLAFDDGVSGPALYAAGRFDAINGVTARIIGRWNGQSWSQVGGGLIPVSVLFGLEAMAVFDDGNGPALYVGGGRITVPGGPTVSVAKWDGQRWTAIGQDLGGRVTCLAVFDDGDGPALYLGGTAQPAINYIARLEGGQWVILDGGVGGPPIPPSNFPSVFSMGTWGDALYVGGNFGSAGGQPAVGLVARQGCATCDPCDANCNGAVDAFDIEPFIDVLFNGATPCSGCAGDVDGDGERNAFDIEPFIACLFGP